MKKITSIILTVILLSVSIPLFGCNGGNGCKGETTRSSYVIDITFDPNAMAVTGSQTFDFYNCFDTAMSELKFNLFGNAFRSDALYKPVPAGQTANAYPDGLNYGGMSVNGVEISGEAVSYEVCGEDLNILSVQLPEAVYPEERVKLDIDFTLNLAKVLARTGYNDNTVNLGNFYPVLCHYGETGYRECVYYPIGDPFCSDVADYTVTLTLPSDYNVASSGKLISTEANNGLSSLKYSLKNARDFAFVMSKEFDLITAQANGVTVNYYYYNDVAPEKSVKAAVDALTTYEELFGEYPYETYSVAEAGFYQGGMEYPGLVFISDNLKETEVIQEVIAHETAHQWWYSLVGNDEISHGFLDEGLTEYSVILFYENNPSYNVSRAELIGIAHKSYTTYCSIYDKIFGGKDTSMLRALGEYSSEYEYVNIAYIKGALMFDYLRQTIGDKAFFNGLKKYASDYAYKVATPDDLAGVYEKLGANTNGFFESWFNGEVIL